MNIDIRDINASMEADINAIIQSGVTKTAAGAVKHAVGIYFELRNTNDTLNAKRLELTKKVRELENELDQIKQAIRTLKNIT